MLGFREALACDTSVKIRARFEQKRERGEFIGAFAPFGYDKRADNSDVLVVDEAAAAVVRDIFRWYAEAGMSLSAIVRRLNERGTPNPTKYKNLQGRPLQNPMGNDGLWSSSTVRRVLCNEVYLGHMVQGRERIGADKLAKRNPRREWVVVKGTHEAIVSAETFAEARRRLALNRPGGARAAVHPLGGLLKCGKCNKAMSRKASKGTAYYCCRTYREKGRQFCGPHSIREDLLFGAVLEALNRRLQQADDLPGLLLRLRPAPGGTDAERERLQRALSAEWAVSDKCYYDWAGGVISEAQFRRLQALCEQRQTELTERLEALERSAEPQTPEPGAESPAELFRRHGRFPALTREICAAFLESVHVYADRSLDIRFL